MMNPYEALGLSKEATQEEIKKAYRLLAKKNHPDLNPGNKKAEEKFKEISHANDLIGSAEARAKFDAGEISEQQEREWQKQYSQRQRSGGFQNRYSHSFENQFEDQDWFSSFFNSQKESRQRASRDLHYKMNVTFKESVVGGEKVITLPNGKNLQVKIPAGINEGAKLRFKGQGEVGPDENSHGDAYIEINIDPLEGWSRSGNDIETEIPITFIEGILGATISVPTMHGPVMLSIPPGVSTGSKLRIKGKGVQGPKETGNQIVKLKVVLPKNITPELRSATEHLKEKYDYHPRGDTNHQRPGQTFEERAQQ